MDPRKVVSHFGGLTQAAEAVKLKSHSAIWQWVKLGEVPPLRQCQLEAITRGKLKMSRAAKQALGI